MNKVVPLHQNNQNPEFETCGATKRARAKKGRFNVAKFNPDFIIDVTRKPNTRGGGGNGSDMDQILERIVKLESKLDLVTKDLPVIGNRLWQLFFAGCAAVVFLWSIIIYFNDKTDDSIASFKNDTTAEFRQIDNKFTAIDQRFDALDQKIEKKADQLDFKLDQILQNTKK